MGTSCGNIVSCPATACPADATTELPQRPDEAVMTPEQMQVATTFTTTLFYIVVGVMTLVFIKAVLRVSAPPGKSAGAGAWVGIALGLIAWLAVPAMLVFNG